MRPHFLTLCLGVTVFRLTKVLSLRALSLWSDLKKKKSGIKRCCCCCCSRLLSLANISLWNLKEKCGMMVLASGILSGSCSERSLLSLFPPLCPETPRVAVPRALELNPPPWIGAMLHLRRGCSARPGLGGEAERMRGRPRGNGEAAGGSDRTPRGTASHQNNKIKKNLVLFWERGKDLICIGSRFELTAK